MTFKQWLRNAFGPRVQGARTSRRGRSRQPSRRWHPPRLEWLEDRTVIDGHLAALTRGPGEGGCNSESE